MVGGFSVATNAYILPLHKERRWYTYSFDKVVHYIFNSVHIHIIITIIMANDNMHIFITLSSHLYISILSDEIFRILSKRWNAATTNKCTILWAPFVLDFLCRCGDKLMSSTLSILLSFFSSLLILFSWTCS